MKEICTDNDTLHAKLREATRNLHRRLDHHPLLAPLVQPGLDQRRYGDALLALYGVHAPLEEAIAAFFNRQHPGIFDYASRSKTPALTADLAELGRMPSPMSKPVTVPIHPIGSLAESVGVLYPLEGSMLGAQVILRQLPTGSGNHLPTRFFSCYGDQAHVRWRSFLTWADTHCPAAHHDIAIAAAQRVFTTIADHLDFMAQHLSIERT